MKTGIILLNFGEPEEATEDQVVPYLERIFFQNAALENADTDEARRKRARELAERRAPGLLEDYRAIGGSPLNAQCFRQRELLESELRSRRHSVNCYVGMQFTAPSIFDAVKKAKDDGVEQLVALPVYPLCGESTTMAALDDVREALHELAWDPDLREITGWHRHPDYARLHGDHIREFVGDRDVALHDPDTRVVFSAHGTPRKYLEDGPRYVKYVEEFCRLLARELGVGDKYELGYQNHANRGVEWTQPEIDDVVRDVTARRIIVVAVSFMHEQSETLSELDRDLRAEAEARGLGFHRVPVPHDDPRFIDALADLCEGLMREVPSMGEMLLKGCLCRTNPNTYCLNAAG